MRKIKNKMFEYSMKVRKKQTRGIISKFTICNDKLIIPNIKGSSSILDVLIK
jgi:hypothetical protein